MKREDVVREVSKKTKISQRKVNDVVEAIMDVVVKNVGKGKKIVLIGFGSFEAVKRPARAGRNPQNGTPIKIPAKTVPVFSVGKRFKEKVNKKR